MQEELRNHIQIHDSKNISILNISYGYLLREYVKIIFSRLLPYAKAVVVCLNHPIDSSIELANRLNSLQNSFSRSKTSSLSRNYNLPETCKLSLLCEDESEINQIADFLALTWISYDFSEIYFLPNEESIKDQENIIFNSKKISAIDEKNLTLYACCFKDHLDDYMLCLYNESNIPLTSILTPDPALSINSLIKEGILYHLPYEQEVGENRTYIDLILSKLDQKDIFESPHFEINESSTLDCQIIDIQKKDTVFVQIEILKNEINFNIDRVNFAISIKSRNTDRLYDILRLILFSKVIVRHRGYYQTKLYFLDQNNVILKTISRTFFPIFSIFSKKEVFEYEPICKTRYI